MSDLIGVILAGGRGRRMGSLGDEYPKALLPIGNRPLISHHLQLLRSLDVPEVYVVVGHRGADLAAFLGDGQEHQLKIRYVEQGPPLGSAHALARLRPYIHQPFLLLLGDYYFEASEPDRLVQRLRKKEGAAISVKREPDTRLIAEACAVQVDRQGRVASIVEKPRKPATDLKGCGFYALPPEFFDAVSLTPRTALRDEYEITVALDLFIRSGHTLYAEEIIRWDNNLTAPENVLQCNLRWLDEQSKNTLVAADAYVDEGVHLERVIIGSDATIQNIPSITNSVVFPGSEIIGGGKIQGALVTPSDVIQCA